MIRCNCLDPVLIVNPQLTQAVARFDKIVVDGRMRSISGSERFDILNGDKSVSTILRIPYAHSLSKKFKEQHSTQELRLCYHRLYDFVDHSFLLNSETGETLPLYQFVPCGKCDVCNSKKLASYAQRCSFALQESGVPAYFVTFTFNKEHLIPVEDKTLFQNFKKRFKHAVSKNFDCDPSSIKFICTSEIGRHGRLHYHCVVFGIPFLSYHEPEHKYYVRKLFQYCWREPDRLTAFRYLSFKEYLRKYPQSTNIKKYYDPKSYGYINVSQVKNTKNAITYVLKYAFKDLTEQSENHCWRSVSINLGLEFAKKYKPYVLSSHDGKFDFKDIASGEIKHVALSSYYINKLFPSESKLIPVQFRRRYFNICAISEELLSTHFLNHDQRIMVHEFRLFLKDKYPFMECLQLVSEGCSYHCLKSDLFPDAAGRQKYIFDSICQIRDFLCDMVKFDIVYDDVVKQLADRSELFLKYSIKPDLSDGQLVGLAHNFVKDIRKMRSISTL